MTRRGRAWLGFALAAGVLLAALLGVTAVALERERGEAEARERAVREERVRLALWRMDTALSQVLAVEAARPPWQYEGSFPFRYTASIPEMAPSPLLETDFPPFRLHFQRSPKGVLTSPQVPGPIVRLPDPVPAGLRARMEEGERRLLAFEKSGLSALLPAAAKAARVAPPAARASAGAGEYGSRAARNTQGQQQAIGANFALASFPEGWPPFSLADVSTGPLTALWAEIPAGGAPELLFLRRASARDGEHLQGIWADWPELRRWLLAEGGGGFPGADLRPLPAGAVEAPRALASVPALFDPGPAPAVVLPGWTPTRTVLSLAWAAALAAGGIAALLLRASLDTAERRERFVSAVTHELRTPLTTFRMYAQMLRDGMAPPGAEKEYLATLERESERLARVVESVLLYARLEEGRGGPRVEVLEAAALLDRVAPVLERRAAEGGLALRVGRALPAGARVEADPQAVEQVLLNLVDNACKYAAGGGGLGLDARVEGGRLVVEVADGGPGIPPAEREAIFEPFRRLPRDEAGSAGGAGLGLALARALARAQGGDLVAASREGPGAVFRVTLPTRG